MTKKEFQRVTVGDTLTYHLALSEQPTHPEKEWHGRVEQVLHEREGVEVVVLDKGYHEESEFVRREQIVAVTHQMQVRGGEKR